MKKIICIIPILCISLIFTGCINPDYDYIILSYLDDCKIDENDEKFGEVSGGDVLIKDFKGNKIVSLELDFVAAQIALAEKYFYVLKRGDNISITEATIYQYDYKGNKIKEYTEDGINAVFYQDGYLFFDKWKDEDDEGSPFLYVGAITARYYIQEKDFGRKVKKMEADKKGICKVGDITFYYHKAVGYFCTKPDAGEYGRCQYSWLANGEFDKENDGQGKETRVDMLQKLIKKQEGVCCGAWEYLDGKVFYGVCIVWRDRFEHLREMPLQDIVTSFSYQYDCEAKKLTVLKELKEGCGIIATDSYIVYQKGNEILSEDYKTGEVEKLCELKRIKSFKIELQNNYLLIYDDRGEEQYVRWKERT